MGSSNAWCVHDVTIKGSRKRAYLVRGPVT